MCKSNSNTFFFVSFFFFAEQDGLADFECDRARIAAISRLAKDSLAPRERTGVTASLAARTVMEMETFSE